MSWEYRVVIPSAERVESIATKTLALLADRKVDPSLVDVWVPNDRSADEYNEALRSFGVAIRVAPHDPTNASLELLGERPVNVGAARNYIIRQYPVGTRLVSVDDDIRDVRRATSPKQAEPITDLDEFFRSMFRDTDALAANLWGVYPVPNPYFMKPRMTTDLRYIAAGLYGFTITGEDHELVVLDDKEDFERSIRYYLAHGRVVRNEQVCMMTTGYEGAGGLQLTRTPLRVEASARWLVAEFPALASLNMTKKSGKAEVRLRDRRR